MTTDLLMLLWSGVLCLLLPGVYLSGRVAQRGGIAWGLGNRDSQFALTPWVGRAQRAHLNLIENLPTFIILVLVAHVTGRANATTALGATIFFWSRVAHAAAYTLGILYLRTALFILALAGEVMILLELL